MAHLARWSQVYKSLKNRSYSPIDESVSVRNIWNRYHEIDTIFPNEIEDKSLVYFCDWLLERVVLVEINTTDQNMAIEIFETMNDRGLSLSNTDMLKGFLFTKIESELIPSTNILWRKRITELIDHGKNTDSEFIKHWLRGKYAETIRLGKKNATPKDFDLIGTAFHKWVRDKHKLIKLNCAQDYKNFVNSDFKKMSQRYIELLNASDKLTEGFEYVYYNSVTGLTLQYLPIMAAITPDDDDETFRCKVELVAKYLNIFVARRMVNYRNFGYSTIVYSIFNLAKDVRNKDCNILRNILSEQIKKIEESFDGIQWFGLNQRNGIHIRYLLARMTDWIENSKGRKFSEYMNRELKDPFEVEHIWAKNDKDCVNQFSHYDEFSNYRNGFGGLILLPKKLNASLGAARYKEKLPIYFGQNMLAKSLNPQAYKANPSFLQFIEETGLHFKPYPDQFTKSDFEERKNLYKHICEKLWSPTRLGFAG